MSDDFLTNAREELKNLAEQDSIDESEALSMLLDAGKDRGLVSVKVSGITLNVYRTIPRDIEEKILQFRQRRAEYGNDYVPKTVDEDKAPLYALLAGLCADVPYNKQSLWRDYDVKSNGLALTFFEDLMTAIKEAKEKKMRKFR